MIRSIKVQNLKCGGCANTIITKISEITNISDVEVNNETSIVSFYAENSDDILKVKNKLQSLGYPSIDDANGILSKAKSFVSCASGRIK